MNNTSESYLVTEVMTATPQKLQLMLIDAGICAGQRALKHLKARENEQACECIIRAQQIVGEMISALDYETKSELVRKVAGVYLFVYRAFMDAAFTHDQGKVNDALKVLAVERDTWRLLCEKLAESAGKYTPSKTSHAPVAANIASNVEITADPPTSFSLEA
jgi:flagellar secretion chaperone FliS